MINKQLHLRIILVVITLIALLSSALVSAQEDTLLYFQDFESGWPDGWESDYGWEVAESDSGSALYGSGHNWVVLIWAPGRISPFDLN